MPKGVVAELRFPAPPPIEIAGDGSARTTGLAYALTIPALASEAVEIVTSTGRVFRWRPTETAYCDADGTLDYVVGSSPVSLEAAVNHVRFRRIFPESADVFLTESDRVKHYTTLHLPPRPPAEYLGTGIRFGLSGEVSGVVLPLGVHDEIEVGDLKLPVPVAWDLCGSTVEGYYEVLNSPGGQQLFVWFDADFLLNPATVYPVTIDPTVEAGVLSDATRYPSGRRIDRFSNGVLLAVYRDGNTPRIRYSADNGQTWNLPASGEFATRPLDNLSLFIDAEDFAHICGTDVSANTGGHFYYRLTPDAARTSYTVVATKVEYAADIANGERITSDLVAVKDGATWYVHYFIAQDVSSTGNGYLRYRLLTVDAAGTVTIGAQTTLVGPSSNGGFCYPTAGVDAVKNVHVAFRFASAAGIPGTRYKLGLFQGNGVWDWSGASEQISGVAPNVNISLTVDDLGRALVAFSATSGALNVYERGVSGGWASLSPPAINPTYVSVSVAEGSGDVYVAVTNSTVVIAYLVYSRTSLTWTGPTSFDSGNTCYYPSLRRSTKGGFLHVLYTWGTTGGYEVRAFTLGVNTAPTAPDGLSPDNGAGRNGSLVVTLTATAHDTPGDYPTNVQWQIQEDAPGATIYYVTGAGALTAAETWIATGGGTFNLSRQIAAGAMAQGKQWKWRVKTRDAAGTESPWSSYAIFKTSAPPTATIVEPAAGATITGPRVTMTVSVDDPEGRPLGSVAYRLYDDNAGAKGFVVREHNNVAAFTRTIDEDLTPYNGLYVWLEVQPTDADGIVGPAVAQRHFVSFTPPQTPLLSASAQNANGRIHLQVTNPAPGAGQPAVVENDLYKLIGGAWVRIAAAIPPNGTFDDYAAPSGAAQTYRVQAIADTTATANSATAQATLVLAGVWLHDVTDPAGTAIRLARNTQRAQNWEGEVTVRHFAGRSKPAAEFGDGEANGVDYGVLITPAEAAWAPLMVLIQRKATLCVRDNAGRRLFGIIPRLPSQDLLVGGQTATLAVTEIDHSEAV